MVKGRGKTARTSAAATASPRSGKASGSGGGGGAGGGAGGGTAPTQASPAPQKVAPPAGTHRGPEPILGMTREELVRFHDDERARHARTRAEWDAVVADYGTPDEVFQKLRGALRERGATHHDLVVFDRLHSPENLKKLYDPEQKEGYLDTWTDFKDGRDEVERKLNGPGGEAGNIATNAYRDYHMLSTPEGVRHWVGLADPGGQIYDKALVDYFDFEGRPMSKTRVASKHGLSAEDLDGRIDEMERGRGFSEQAVAHAAARLNGRRYLWPDERPTA